jgi:hypothetical protein
MSSSTISTSLSPGAAVTRVQENLNSEEVEMTKPKLSGVGYCALMNKVGDWAFDYALRIARREDAVLDVFFFPTSPCEEHDVRGRWGELIEMAEDDQIALEREVRLYYDDRLGDFLEVGFRICLGDEVPELRRCLMKREYDVLVLAYQKLGCPFGERPIEEFAESMPCPVVMVGPSRPDEIHLNPPATLITDELDLKEGEWKELSRGCTSTAAKRVKRDRVDVQRLGGR